MIVRLLLVVLASAFLMEGFLRYVLFVDDPVTRFVLRSAPALRQPRSYAPSFSSEYWKLHYVLIGAGRGREARHDPLLGWVRSSVEPETYRHARENELGARRPVLLFGDSFGGCVTPAADCWEGLLASSELGGRYAMLNFAAGGYGFGQIALLCKEALANLHEREPIVIVSVLVDDDLDRSLLDFRAWPKPAHRVDADGVVRLVERELPATRDEFIEEAGIGITSYAWRFVRCAGPWSRGVLNTALDEHLREVYEVNRGILEDLVAELEASDCEYFFAVFHGRTFLSDKSSFRQRDEFFVAELERLGVPYVLSRDALREDARRTGRKEADYFVASGRGKNHYTALGNEVVFRALREGILGSYHGGPSPEELHTATIELGGEDAMLRFEDSSYPPFDDPADRRRLVFRVGADGPTRASWTLAGKVTRLTGVVKRVPDRPGGRAELSVLADGEERFRAPLEGDAQPLPLDVDLSGVRELTLVASGAGETFYIAAPAFTR